MPLVWEPVNTRQPPCLVCARTFSPSARFGHYLILVARVPASIGYDGNTLKGRAFSLLQQLYTSL